MATIFPAILREKTARAKKLYLTISCLFCKLYRYSFLELGGNSVAAVNASSVLQKEDFDVPVTEFFTNRPLSEMINAVEENENQSLLVPDISMISFYKFNLNTSVTSILTIAWRLPLNSIH